MIIVDTNILVYLLFSNYDHSISFKVLEKASNWFVPSLMIKEFSNVIVTHFRQKIITRQEALDIHKTLKHITRRRTLHINDRKILEIALESNLSIYDAEYVALAKQQKAMLVTNDKKVLKNFPKIALTPEQYLALN